ncbi:aminotransferase class IV, partial [Candidatus Margulisiibacteriota bacterium]
ETTSANVFFIKKNTLFTPKSSVILPGITKQKLIENCQSWGFKVKERKIYKKDLKNFDEIFLTSSLRKIIRVKKLAGFPGLYSKEKTNNIRKYYGFFKKEISEIT